jgi:hypothetical protein
MTQRDDTVEAPVRMGGDGEERSQAFGGGELWIGQHEADEDILIFDPAEADPHASVLSLYSLTQHRMRRFPRLTVLERIHRVSGKPARARAKKEYAQRAKLKASYEQVRSGEAVRSRDRQRDGVLAAHRRFIESTGLTYEGVRDTGPDSRRGRRTKCHLCGIALDDFASAVCGICSGVLCSCGACGCGRH